MTRQRVAAVTELFGNGSDDSIDLEVSRRLTFQGHVPPDEEVIPVVELSNGLRILNERKADLTKARAEDILRLPEFIVHESHVDRNLRDAHVTYIINCMKRGTFHPEWVTIISCVCLEAVAVSDELTLPAGTDYRMNGQHTCWGRLYMPDDWPCPVKFMRYEAANVQTMRQLYASIDRGAIRTNGNVIDSYLAGTEQFRGVPSAAIRAIAAGLSLWLWPEPKRQKRDADDIAHQIQTTYSEQTSRVRDYVMNSPRGTAQRGILYRMAVIAALYETFSKLPTRAHEFWDAVRDGVGFTSVKDPRKKLHDALNNCVLVTSAIVRSSKKRHVTQEEVYRWCIQCWNYWRAEDEMTNLRISLDGKRPKAK